MLKVLTLLLLIYSVTAILIRIDGSQKRHCLHKIIGAQDTLHVSFVVTGDSDNEKISAKLFDPNKVIIYSGSNTEEGEHEYDIKVDGLYLFCFYPQSNKKLYVSFEFYTKFEGGHIVNMAKDSNIQIDLENFHEMKNEISNITTMLNSIEENIRFTMDRRNKHYKIAGNIQQSVDNISYLKIFLIIFMSIIQIFFIARFFKNSKKVGLNPFFDSGL